MKPDASPLREAFQAGEAVAMLAMAATFAAVMFLVAQGLPGVIGAAIVGSVIGKWMCRRRRR